MFAAVIRACWGLSCVVALDNLGPYDTREACEARLAEMALMVTEHSIQQGHMPPAISARCVEVQQEEETAYVQDG